MATASRIGFVGVGRMGANMARRLKEQGFTIMAVTDRARKVATALAAELDCEAAPTPARVAELSETVITMVSDDAAMREIYTANSLQSLLARAKNRLSIN